MNPRASDGGSGRDAVGVAVLEPMRVVEHVGHKTTWSIGRWNRRGLRCANADCRHEIVEAPGRQYDPYSKTDGLIFAPVGKVIPIERHPFRTTKNVQYGFHPVKDAIITLGSKGFLMRCPCCGEVMKGFAPDWEEGRLPDVIEENGELSFSDRVHGNLLLNEGITELCNCITDENTPQPWDSANAQVGTGTSSTAAAATDTDLLANGSWQGMEATFPSVASQTASWKGSWATGEGNQSWQEFSLRNDSVDDLNLNRKVEDKGTKSSGVWTLQIDILFA